MIPFEFAYLRPDTLAEAARAHGEFARAIYYAGGSEVITMCRAGAIRPDAVIDIKHIPELTALSSGADWLTLGAALTLNQVKESKRFPLLSLACGRIADHTNQCRITLGGNLAGTIIYREASLPLLLCDAEASLYGPNGARTTPLAQMRLQPGELIVSVRAPAWALTARHAHIKQTAQEKIDYPLVNATALWKGSALRIAFSGLAARPLRSRAVEAALNDRGASCESRAERAVNILERDAHGDVEGSKEYRLFVARNILRQILEDWEHDAL